MKCYKEEALRAKDIAENKLQSKDFTSSNPRQQQQSRKPTKQGLNGGSFWTMCSFCSVRWQYYREVLNRYVRCRQCSRLYIACEVDVQSTQPAANSSDQAFGQQTNIPNHGAFKAGVGSPGNLHTHGSNTKSYQKKDSTSNVSEKPKGERRSKRVAESGDVDDESGQQPLKWGKRSGAQCSDHEAKMNDQNGLGDALNDDPKEVKQEQIFYYEEWLENANVKLNVRGKETVGSSKIEEALEHSISEATYHPGVFVYPDAEFSDFDKDKKEGYFASGQIWAIYDSTDGMPRFYAIVKNVLSPGFKLRITWFEPKPKDSDEIKWVNEELPSACGKYILGKSETTEDHQMFSHQIFCEKISHSTFKVYPRKGETWALFKNWDIKWYMDAESHRQYEFEFAEILSDYVEGVGVFVAYLAKLKGFVSLFSRIAKGGNSSFQIPPNELFRFSHRVPSFKMTGQERVGVPVGSYEFDPLSLPKNLEEIAVPGDLEVEVGHSPSVGVSTRSSDMLIFLKNLEGNASTVKVKLERSDSAEENQDPVDHIDDVCAPSTLAKEFPEIPYSIPYSMFCNFNAAERSLEKFQIGQIWAFYSDEDGLPKYYGQIKRVRTSPRVELQVTYLTNCWLPENAIRWEDKDMIISCGRFKVKPGSRTYVYNNIYYVSHQVHANTVGNDKEYEFFPRKGEIWALYRTWTTKMKCSDLKNWEYDIVEVIEEKDSWMEVLLLEMVSGYNTVFKGKLNKVGSPVNMTISRTDLIRFSHQIPAFKLTEENGNGNLRGFWELDPVAIPSHYFSGLK